MKAKRRINSTNRKRIHRENVDIRMVTSNAGAPLKASAAIELADYNFPPTALLSIEAYHRSSGMRFDCGTVGNQKLPEVMLLDEIDQSGSVLFRIKVTDANGERGRLLGSAERIQPLAEDENKDRRAFFPVLYRDLGEQVWKVEINPGDRPKLILNREVPGIQHRLKNDPFMKGMLFPAAFRVVMEAIASGSHDTDEDDDETATPWQEDWLKFGQDRLGISSQPPADVEERHRWVEEAVDKFASEFGFVKEIRKQEDES